MEFLRTPDSRFEGLPGYPYVPKYHVLGGGGPTPVPEAPAEPSSEAPAEEAPAEEAPALRMHYVDEGPRNGRPILMLHGEPSWSYLYRHMISIVTEAGYRAIAPDLIGFGRSDKPIHQDDYSYQSHDEWLEDFVCKLDLKRIILVCQDWGGLLGLRMVARHPERFDAVVAANTFLPSGREPVGEAFKAWQRFSQEVPEFDVSRVVQKGCIRNLNEKVLAAYDAPFPDESYKAGARKFPMLVPTEADSPDAIVNQELWGKLAAFDKPFVTAFSDGDPITRGADKFLQAAITGARDRKHSTIKGGGHFLQEERGPELARVVLTVANSLIKVPPKASPGASPGAS